MSICFDDLVPEKPLGTTFACGRGHLSMRVFQSMGRLHLMLDNVPEALDAYLKAIAILMEADSYTRPETLGDEMDFLCSLSRFELFAREIVRVHRTESTGRCRGQRGLESCSTSGSAGLPWLRRSATQPTNDTQAPQLFL